MSTVAEARFSLEDHTIVWLGLNELRESRVSWPPAIEAARLARELTEWQSNLTTAEEKLEGSTTELATLRGLLATLENVHKALTTQIDEMTVEVQRSEIQVRNCHQNISQVQQEISELTNCNLQIEFKSHLSAIYLCKILSSFCSSCLLFNIDDLI